MAHYCKICGEYKSNESFSGGGHARHICKKCKKLPVGVREERMTLNRIYDLSIRLNKGQRIWLEMMKADTREPIKSAAEDAWNARFAPRPSQLQLPDAEGESADEEEELLLEAFGEPEDEEQQRESWMDDPEYEWLWDEGTRYDPNWEPPEDCDLELPF